MSVSIKPNQEERITGRMIRGRYEARSRKTENQSAKTLCLYACEPAHLKKNAYREDIIEIGCHFLGLIGSKLGGRLFFT